MLIMKNGKTHKDDENIYLSRKSMQFKQAYITERRQQAESFFKGKSKHQPNRITIGSMNIENLKTNPISVSRLLDT